MEVYDETRFHMVCPETGQTLFRTRSEIAVGDLLLNPHGVPQRVQWKTDVGPDLYRVSFKLGPDQSGQHSFICSPRQRLHLRARGWPQRRYDERSDCFEISWISGNLLRKTRIPLKRITHANVVWNMAQGMVEPLCLPLEMYESLPDDKRKLLGLVHVTSTLAHVIVPLSVKFEGYGQLSKLHVSGDGLFASREGMIFAE